VAARYQRTTVSTDCERKGEMACDLHGRLCATPTEWVVDPRIEPACGFSPVELDPHSPPITPVVGELISKYIELLCRRCIGIKRKRNWKDSNS
jgi:hypothetical protein